MQTVKSNIEPLNITVDGGGAKVVRLSVSNTKEATVNAMLYPNVTVNQGSGDVDGGIIM